MDETEQMWELGFRHSAVRDARGGFTWYADMGRCAVFLAHATGAYRMSTLGYVQDGFPTALAAAMYYRLQHPAPSLR